MQNFIWITIIVFCFTTNLLFAQARIGVGYKEVGMASYYEERFDNRPTVSGEKFDNNDLVASHRKIPFGTKVKVTNLSNNKWVIVRIIDRGPYAHGRIIDVSLNAAKKLDLLSTAVAKVEIEVLSPEGKTLAELQAEKEKEEAKNQDKEKSERVKENGKKEKAELKENDFLIGKTYNMFGSLKKPEGFGIQVASFDTYTKVQNFLKPYQEKADIGDIFIQVSTNTQTNKKTYRILVNEYKTRAEAQKDYEKIRKVMQLTNSVHAQPHLK
ncbi:MAG: septal ring lytic transglycosylase RlpA family protein [Microscillaceae bacterium]|nr:septal ring lytic transglycosylase RlpA family protein [Microscillaceae bacterium]MDW8461102.1 septal ring lytic transglycosylase RlpA family protein [Cytophagales bacterium]